jgi:hypothetical protein
MFLLAFFAFAYYYNPSSYMPFEAPKTAILSMNSEHAFSKPLRPFSKPL